LTECDPRELALYASEAMGNRRDRMFSCILLKVMHVIHHISARDLRFVLPISDADVNQMLVHKVEACAERMRRLGFPLLDFVGGQKRRDSVIAKLLVKRDNLAVELYDRVRFRFVVAELDDLVPTLRFLMQEVVPFNYVVPGQTQNDLVEFAALLRSHPIYRAYESKLQLDIGLEEERRRASGPRNEFSGQTYRVVNFVADIPLVVPDEQLLLARHREELGRIVFAVAEFQVIDAETARLNDSGDNAHHRYKSRQRARERQRLERGMRGIIGRRAR
ncbi:MAG: TIGR04552 family protein, partial [Deltaproteobacteria bacterium]|nr:TIGR04552 family protein [Deltaproteobacteria bacterium]